MVKKKVAEWVVETLEAAGVKNCFGIVGDSLNHVTEAIYHSGINWVHMRHEEAGAFAAGAAAYLTGELSACAGSCGPGSLHFINGIFEANRNRSPVVLIASQIPASHIGADFPQEVDFKSLYAQCSVFFHEIRTPEQAQHITALACQAALEKRGVAVVVLPADIAAQTVSGNPHYPLHRQKTLIRPDDSQLEAIAALLAKGKKIGIFAGAGVQDAHKELLQLAGKLQAPIAHTSRAKDFVEYDNPYNMGMTGMLGVKSGYHMVGRCDTLLMLGTDFAYPQFYSEGAALIQIDEDPAHIGRRHPVQLGMVGDIKATLQALLPLLPQREDTGFLRECLEERKKVLEKLVKEEEKAGKDIIHPQYLVSLLNKYADDDVILAADAGSAMAWVLRHFSTNGKRRTLVSMLHGTMANAMPQALGAQKAYPGRQVISLSGDGGLAMLMGDMLTAVQEKLPVKIIVLNNSSLNFVELEQKTDGLVNRYTDLQNPDFGKLAEVMGYKGWTVEKSQELEAVMPEFLAADGPALLNVKTTPYELVMPPHIEAGQVAHVALYGIKAIAEGRFKDVKDLLEDNFLK